MKKVGLYLDAILGGGTYQYNLTILDAFQSLPTKEFQTVITYTNDTWHTYLSENEIQAKYIPRTLFSRSWFQIRHPLSVWKSLSPKIDSFTKGFVKENCDLWVFPSQDAWGYSLPLQALSTVHDLMHRYERKFPEAGSPKEYRLRELHYTRMCEYSKGILVDSEIGKQQLIESYNIEANKVKILPFISPAYMNDAILVNVKEIYGLPEKYLFYPAQFWEHKNHKSLVRAAATIISKYPDLKLVFVGKKKNGYSSLLEIIKKHKLEDAFIFLNYVPDKHMAGLYKSAQGLIMPTFFGPTNIPPLEAFKAGCPVAASNIYGMSEQIGEAGILFDPNSDIEIAVAMEKLWNDNQLTTKLRKIGIKKSNEWSQEQFNNKFNKIIIELLSIK